MKTRNQRSEVQNIIWDIMKDVLQVIDRHDFEYYMLGGTLLGAVRHKGFIAWDDDIDIGMPRDDYEAFLKIVQRELPEYLELRTYWDESDHHYYFARIVDIRHSLRRTGSTIERMENVWIDVFPLDGMPNRFIPRRIHMLRLLYARARYHMATFDKVNTKRPNRPLYERIIIRLISVTGMGVHSDPRKWLDKIDFLLRKYPPKHSRWIVNFMGQYIFKEMFPKSYYGKGRLYPFEETKLWGPKYADKVLTQMYGDYMTPPKNKNAHAAEFVE